MKTDKKITLSVPCLECNGTGLQKYTCDECDGTGEISLQYNYSALMGIKKHLSLPG
jgi:DnaJ-class molecular chaperone